MSRTIPNFATDEEAERIVETADLAAYGLSGLRPTRFEFAAKDSRVNFRVPASLLDAVKRRAAERGIPYQRLIREAMERVVVGIE